MIGEERVCEVEGMFRVFLRISNRVQNSTAWRKRINSNLANCLEAPC